MTSQSHQEVERGAVEAEQIKAFFKETNDQNLVGALVFSLIVYVVHVGIPAWTWLPALLSLYVVTLVRAWLIVQYRRTPNRHSTAAWGRSQTITGGLSGICWGLASAAMLSHLSTENQLFVLTVITVSAASSASEGYSYAPPSWAFVIGCLSPPIFWLLTVGDRLHWILAVMLLVFLPMTLWQGHKRNRGFIEAQQLRFRNEALAKELRVQRDSAEQAYLSKARFLAAASHDLRQPMQALSIFHELLRSQVESDRGKDVLANAQRATEAMNMLLDALLDVSKLDASIVKPDRHAFHLQALIDEITQEFVALAEHKELRLDARPTDAIILSDPVLLGQVLRNLLSNAIRYTPSGRVLIACRRRRDQVEIGVFDTGIGIEANQHEAIFGEFYQIGNKERDRNKGLGLGLAIVDRIVRLLDHRLTLRSEPGRGSCFVVSVPVATASDIPVPSLPNKAAAEPPGSLAGRHILMIDDEEAIRTGMSDLLLAWGCKVTTASSVVDALCRVDTASIQIDAVISDMGLPGPGNGIDAIRALRNRCGSRLPALLVTGDTSQAAMHEAKKAALIMLHKPIKPARLRAALSEAIAESQRREADQ